MMIDVGPVTTELNSIEKYIAIIILALGVLPLVAFTIINKIRRGK